MKYPLNRVRLSMLLIVAERVLTLQKRAKDLSISLQQLDAGIWIYTIGFDRNPHAYAKRILLEKVIKKHLSDLD